MQRHTFFELGAKAIDANLFIIPGRCLDNADEFQTLATADRLLYQEKRAKKLRRMTE